MTYMTQEESAFSGRPEELYKVTIGVANQYYTSADHDIVFDGETWVSYAMSRGDYSLDSEVNRTSLNVESGYDHPVPELFKVAPPDEVVQIQLWRKHLDDPDPTSFAVAWTGRILNVAWGLESVTWTCQNLSTSLKQPGLSRVYSRSCPYQVFDEQCRAQSATFMVPGTASVVTTTTIQVLEAAAYLDGYFDGGTIEWVGGFGNIDSRTILTHIGAELTLMTSTYGLDQFSAVSLFPGCDQTRTTCDSVFGNILNYGGFPFIPIGENPFVQQVF